MMSSIAALAWAAFAAGIAPGEAELPRPLKVVMLSGSEEYESDRTLAAFKAELESKPGGVEVTLLKAEGVDKLPGLDALEDADVALFFTRRLTIDGPELAKVKAYCDSGRPIVAVRTASHGFQKWLEFDKEILGGDYRGHHGKDAVTTVEVLPAGKGHPILEGVGPIRSASSLYKNESLAPDCTPLLRGSIGNAAHPVAWVRTLKDGKQRVFSTSLGGQGDFENPDFRRMLANAIFWAAGAER